MSTDIVRPGAIITAAQVDHIKAHQDRFEQHVGPDRTVEEYLEEYIGEKPDIYERLCSDLGLAPLPSPPVAQGGFTTQPAQPQPEQADLSTLIQNAVGSALGGLMGGPASFEDTLAEVDPTDSEAALAMLDWLLKTGRLGRVGVLDNGGGYLFMYAEPKGASKAGYRPGATQGDRIVDEAVQAQREAGSAPVKRGMCGGCVSVVKQLADGRVVLDDPSENAVCPGTQGDHVMA